MREQLKNKKRGMRGRRERNGGMEEKQSSAGVGQVRGVRLVTTTERRREDSRDEWEGLRTAQSEKP